MRNTVLVLVGMMLLAGFAPAQTWMNGPATPFAYSRFDAEYFPGTAKVYFLGGRVGTSTTSGAIYSYTPATGAYAAVGVNMPKAVSNYDICRLRDDHNPVAGDTYGLYVFGGRFDASPNYTDSVQAYYPVSNTAAISGTDLFPGRAGGQITVGMSCIVDDNKAYVCGGFSSVGSAVSDEVWLYDPMAAAGTRWTALPSMLLARAYPVIARVDSFIFLCGGDTWDGTYLYARTQTQRLNVNDIGSGWTTVADMPMGCDEARGFGFDSDEPCEFAGKLITAGRGVWSSESAECFVYDVARDSWQSFPSLAQRRRNHAGAFIPAEAGGTGVPGIWIWGGRQDQDTLCLTVTEYYPIEFVGVSEKPGVGRREPAVGVAPNPGRNRLNLAGTESATLLDLSGREALVLRPGGNDVSRLAPGVYFLRNGGSSVPQKVVIQH
jgi:hypothetical protein